MTATVLPKPKVGDPLIFRNGVEDDPIVVRPCSKKHRTYFLRGYIVLSCSKCVFSRINETTGDETSIQGKAS